MAHNPRQYPLYGPDVHPNWYIPCVQVAPGPKWNVPPPRTYKVPYWVGATKTVLPLWMFNTAGELLDNLEWDDGGQGYTANVYEVSWTDGPGSGGGGFGGGDRGGRGGGRGGGGGGWGGFDRGGGGGGRGGGGGYRGGGGGDRGRAEYRVGGDRGGRGGGDRGGGGGGYRGGGDRGGRGGGDRGGRGGGDRGGRGGRGRGTY